MPVSVEEYRDAGYLPAAVVNYLALLGWAPSDEREVLSLDELVAAFDLERVHQAAATFDPQKLEWLNGEHIRTLPLSDLTAAVLPFARDRYGARLDVRVFEAAVALAQERATTLVQIADQADVPLHSRRRARHRRRVVGEGAADREGRRDPRHARSRTSSPASGRSRASTCAAVDALGVKARKALPVVYAAIEGRTAGLPLFDAIFLLGRESALRRLRRGAAASGYPP